jgi:DNA-binding MarR family transcriptional regulator
MHLQVLYPFGMSSLHPAFEQAWTRLIRAERGLVEAIEAELRAGDFPPLAWYDVLLELWRRPNHRLRQSELQSELLLAQYNLSRLVDRLEGAGLVRRESCRQDARSRWVVATPAGLALRETMWPAYAAAIERHVGSKLSAEEAAALAGLLGKLLGR